MWQAPAHAVFEGENAATAASATAAAPAVPNLPQLPGDVLTNIFSHLPARDVARLKLCSTQFAAAVDPLIKAIRLTHWPERPISINSRLQHVTRLDLSFNSSCSDLHSSCPTAAEEGPTNTASSVQENEVRSNDLAISSTTPARWQQLKALLSQLPHLSSLALPLWDQDAPLRRILPPELVVYLTQLTRLDMEDLSCPPAGVQLPGLRAASFTSSDCPASLAAIAALAPHIQQLACRKLEIHTAAVSLVVIPGGPNSRSSGQSSEKSRITAVTLPHVTHYGGQALTVTGAATPAEAAAAFGNALPNLQVLYQVPSVSDGAGSKARGYEELLQHLPQLTAVRGRNWFSTRSWFRMHNREHMSSGTWRNIHRISFHSNSYPDGCSDFLDISRSTQLRHVRLTFNYPYTKANELVRELSMLPSLQSLALPAALLCSCCCPEKHYPGLRSSLEVLASKPHLTRLDLLTLSEATIGATYYCKHHSTVRENMKSFIVKAADNRHQQVLQQHSTCQSRWQATSRQRAQWQRDLELHLREESPQWSHDLHVDRRVCGHPVWGVFVDESEW